MTVHNVICSHLKENQLYYHLKILRLAIHCKYYQWWVPSTMSKSEVVVKLHIANSFLNGHYLPCTKLAKTPFIYKNGGSEQGTVSVTSRHGCYLGHLLLDGRIWHLCSFKLHVEACSSAPPLSICGDSWVDFPLRYDQNSLKIGGTWLWCSLPVSTQATFKN